MLFITVVEPNHLTHGCENKKAFNISIVGMPELQFQETSGCCSDESNGKEFNITVKEKLNNFFSTNSLTLKKYNELMKIASLSLCDIVEKYNVNNCLMACEIDLKNIPNLKKQIDAFNIKTSI